MKAPRRSQRRRVAARIGLGLTIAVVAAGSVNAEPYLAVRNGFKCSQCHVNRTGGGKRTDFGFVFSQTALPILKPRPGEPGLLGKLRSPMQTGFMSFGGNFRLNSRAKFHDDAGIANDAGFDVSEGNLYVQAKFGESLSFYIDENVAPGAASNREAFGLIENLPADGYLKFGRMLLPYGLRLLDDDAFIRQVTGFTYANQDLGIEFGVEPGALSAVVAVSNGSQGGTENNQNKQISTIVQWVKPHYRAGGSVSVNRGSGSERRVAGAFAAGSRGRFTVLLEIDHILDRDNATGVKVDQIVGFSELDFLIKRGLNLKLTYEIHDPDLDLTENHRDRFTFGVEAFPIAFTQFSLFYYLPRDIPQNTLEDDDTLLLQAHFFF